MNCAPVVDLPVEGAHQIISDRAYGRDVDQVVVLGRGGRGLHGRRRAAGHQAHPGHGRATADSHSRPAGGHRAREAIWRPDFAVPALADLPAAMRGARRVHGRRRRRAGEHVGKVDTDVIRGAIGFDGLLMSDDLSMQALTGRIAERAPAVHCGGLRRGAAVQRRSRGNRDREPVFPGLQGALAEPVRAGSCFRTQQRAFDVAGRRCKLLASLAHRVRSLNQCDLSPVDRTRDGSRHGRRQHERGQQPERAGNEDWEAAERKHPAEDALVVEPRRLRGAARRAAGAGAHAESGPGQDFGPGAGRAVPRVSSPKPAS